LYNYEASTAFYKLNFIHRHEPLFIGCGASAPHVRGVSTICAER